MHIFLLGFMGAGKSYWGKNLAKLLSCPYYDLDEEIVQDEGKSVADIFAEKGEDYFRNMEREKLQELSGKPPFVISCGGGTPCFFDNMQFMNEHGITVWLNPSVDIIRHRLQRKRYKRPLIAGLPDDELSNFIEKKLTERLPFYQQAKLIIDSGTGDVSNLVQLLNDFTDE